MCRAYQWDREALGVVSDKMHSNDVLSVEVDVNAVLVVRNVVDTDTVAHNRMAASMTNLMMTTGFQFVLHVNLINQQNMI